MGILPNPSETVYVQSLKVAYEENLRVEAQRIEEKAARVSSDVLFLKWTVEGASFGFWSRFFSDSGSRCEIATLRANSMTGKVPR